MAVELAAFPMRQRFAAQILLAVAAEPGSAHAGETEEARDVQRRFREAWRHADVVLTASRF